MDPQAWNPKSLCQVQAVLTDRGGRKRMTDSTPEEITPREGFAYILKELKKHEDRLFALENFKEAYYDRLEGRR
ncbi:hypothetical protein CEE45_10575 [Candidatus Heimdallarchaeota archaeon B3_Heim]|nr:MAG: hypothetical protein CEE45_10575 [Candidatus Heimdallarchaeota archaeon B3_Heim]